jgi:uncharacterized heparinase superfamily protein
MYAPKEPVVEGDRQLFRGVSPRALRDVDVAALRQWAVDLAAGRMRLLNRTRQFEGRIDWESRGEERLWRYNLHYCEYVRWLALLFTRDSDPAVLKTLKDTIDDWIASNRPPRGVGWHSYPLAQRIVNWLYALDLCRDAFRNDPAFRERFITSLYVQSAFLARNLEYDVLGNHLIENGKALLLAGLSFVGREAARWFALGEEILWGQLHEQVLADGGHYERSPMYHVIVLADYIEVASALRSAGVEPPPHVVSKIAAMANWLESVLHPDGEIPLIQDAAFGIAPRAADVLAAARATVGTTATRWSEAAAGVLSAVVGRSDSAPGPGARRPLTCLSPSGYLVLGGRPDTRLIADVGAIGPDYLPAHGHAGLFSFEYSVRAIRVVVDSGVETYEPGPWREFFRSTRAHSTVSIDEADQSDVWAAFRAGRRARVVAFGCAAQAEGQAFAGRHDGYERIRRGLLHTRFGAVTDDGALVVVDHVERATDVAVRSYLHFHPKIEIRRADSTSFDVLGPTLRLRLWIFGEASSSVVRGKRDPIQGWYAPEFGARCPNDTLTMEIRPGLTAEAGFALTPATWDPPVVTWHFSERVCTVTFAAGAAVRTMTVHLQSLLGKR